MNRFLLGSMSVLVSIALLAACASSPMPVDKAPVVPDSLKVPPGLVVSQVLRATGIQIYECRQSRDDAQKYEWVFKAPEATLLDNAGNKVGKHYEGPTWESNDGSKVVGEVKGKDNGPDPAAIPWLLLSAKTVTGKGMFSQTQSIQRLYTTAGKAPSAECNARLKGAEERVPYTATYYFYTVGK
ncbi:DUF3455 domain-containing protein [Undibacterium sp.]|jgi:hypothetical protein|uniref:DUF3455 domain-containing protein n=1 Tax=Undibacterium sp. TaxID=1914977 RepID=UPI002BCC6581|nr:DUF3455 domain-containing protein [Undibacterium sp.]HTD03605.1 DUF3455 domain-containing protein [Undibacterium sp.]